MERQIETTLLSMQVHRHFLHLIIPAQRVWQLLLIESNSRTMSFPPTFFSYMKNILETVQIHSFLTIWVRILTKILLKSHKNESINLYSFKLCRFWGLSDSHSNLITSNNLLWAIKKSYWSRNLFFTLNKLSDITSLRFISERSWHMYELWTNIWVLNHQFQNSFAMI